MKILVISDCHNYSLQLRKDIKQINYNEISLIISLGDNVQIILEDIIRYCKNTPFLAILGNHDSFKLFNQPLLLNKIKNLDGKEYKQDNISIVGIHGSLIYKNSSFPSYTQEMSIELCDKLPKADIIISHTSPYGFHETDNLSHQGFKGISNYIDKYHPKYCIHGHQHIEKNTKYKDTIIQGVYGLKILEI